MSIHTVLKLPSGLYIKIKNNRRPFEVVFVGDIDQATVFANRWVSDANKHALSLAGCLPHFKHVPVRIERKVIELP